MTNKELLIQILSESTDECRAELNIKVNAIMRSMEKTKPGSTQGFYKEFGQAEAASVLREMRQQKVEIVEWFEGQFYRAMQRRPQADRQPELAALL